MHTVRVTREIDAPADDVWKVLDDFGGVAKYNPNVEMSGVVAGPDTGTGATRECILDGGERIEEEIVEYDSGTGYTVNFTDVGDFPLKENVVDIRVESIDETTSVVTMTSNCTPRFGPVGWILAKTMIHSRFRETFEEAGGFEAAVDERREERVESELLLEPVDIEADRETRTPLPAGSPRATAPADPRPTRIPPGTRGVAQLRPRSRRRPA